MATAFDGIGMGQLGSERRFMTGDNPLSETLKGFKTGLMVKGIGESGLGEFLGKILQKSVPPPSVQSMGGILGTTGSQGGVNPFEPDSSQTAPAPDEDPLHQEFNLNKISSQSLTTPNTFNARNPSQDQTTLAMQTASPGVYPSPMNLPQYGQNIGGSSGLSSLLSLFA
jgi:hypothetical protein